MLHSVGCAILGPAGGEFGIGPDSNYAGNLVPLSAGFAYEENPTISYTSVKGEGYLRLLLSPLPLDLTVLLLHALRHSPQATTLLLRSVNGIWNPDFLMGPSEEADPRFAQLALQGRASWSQEVGTDASFVLALASEDRGASAQIAELYELLGFPAPAREGILTLPVRLGLERPDGSALQLGTRSLFEILNLAAAAVEVPEEHVASGIAARLPRSGPASASMRTRRPEDRPRNALTASRHHGQWYFIEQSDTASKLAFRLIESLISVRIADAVIHEEAKPVLTVPVSR
jgi:hypothetical protein